MRLRSIEIVEDRTSDARCDEGFLVLSRLRLRNLYDDGSCSRSYACDLVSRPESDAARAGNGDGNVMEEAGAVVVLELGEAIAACRSGEIPDLKTEVGLLRLADHLGFVPQLDCFAVVLPPELRARHRRLGVAAAPGR